MKTMLNQKSTFVTSDFKKQSGSSLIEILVTVIITATGLLGLAVLQNTGLKASYDSYIRTQGRFLASDLADRIRANPSQTYTLAAGGGTTERACLDDTSVCTPAQIRDFDLYHWQRNAQAMLPDATASLSFDNAANLYTVSLSWNDRTENDTIQGDSNDFKEFNFHFRVNN